jgi:AcrR family transcriptional regulator
MKEIGSLRYKPGHKEQAHQEMVAAAGRGFRKRGFGGIGVDGLAKEASVTSGAFYGHFASKETAFEEAVAAGLDELEAGIKSFRERYRDGWVRKFVDFYLQDKRVCDLSESCALQTLTPEVGRTEGAVKTAFEQRMVRIVQAVADGLAGPSPKNRTDRAWSLLSILSGGVTLARAVDNPKVAAQIAASLRKAALDAAGVASAEG